MSTNDVKPVSIGLIGAGNISDQYLTNIATYPDMEIVAISDLIPEKAQAQAEKYGIPIWGTNEVVLDHPDVKLVLNLTNPEAHVEVSESVIEAGKHVWSEKVIGVDREGARGMLEKAAKAGVRVGVAPDTVLGPGVQTAKRLIENGEIGKPLWASTQMQYQGPQVFHPNPAFLFAKGAGPLLDIGPYYVSALVHILGPVAAVAAVGLRGQLTRKVEVGPLAGQEFPVEVPSTVLALLKFAEGGTAQSAFSNDSALSRQGVLEIHGTEGTIVIPDPNMFGGTIKIIRPMASFVDGGDVEQEVIEYPMEDDELGGRGIGALDLLQSVRAGRPHVANGDFGFHVLDTLLSLEESAADNGAWKTVTSDPGPVYSITEGFDPLAASI